MVLASSVPGWRLGVRRGLFVRIGGGKGGDGTGCVFIQFVYHVALVLRPGYVVPFG